MAAQTEISWCDHTFNPWIGCTKVSAACDHCYAETWGHRFGVEWGNQPRRRTSESNWHGPLKWDRAAKAAGVRRRVFCASLADIFDNQVPVAWRADLWSLIARCPNLDWLLLTKRPQNIAEMLPIAYGFELMAGRPWPWPNVWLGTTTENQEEADRRIPLLLDTPAAVRFISAEPLLGPIDLSEWLWRFKPCDNCPCPDPQASRVGYEECCREPEMLSSPLHWVIVGGESGAGARPIQNPQWARDLRDQCTAADVAFHFKQWGEFAPDDNAPDAHTSMRRVGKKVAGRLLDGREWNEFPNGGHPHVPHRDE